MRIRYQVIFEGLLQAKYRIVKSCTTENALSNQHAIDTTLMPTRLNWCAGKNLGGCLIAIDGPMLLLRRIHFLRPPVRPIICQSESHFTRDVPSDLD